MPTMGKTSSKTRGTVKSKKTRATAKLKKTKKTAVEEVGQLSEDSK